MRKLLSEIIRDHQILHQSDETLWQSQNRKRLLADCAPRWKVTPLGSDRRNCRLVITICATSEKELPTNSDSCLAKFAEFDHELPKLEVAWFWFGKGQSLSPG